MKGPRAYLRQRLLQQEEKQMLTLIPHGSHKSELHLFINSCQTVQCSAEMLFHTIPLLSKLQILRLLYKWFTITLNRLKCGNIDPQEKGVVLTAEELKYNHSKEIQQSAPENKGHHCIWPLGDFFVRLYERK